MDPQVITVATSIATIVGIVIALFQFCYSIHNNKNNNELRNGPDFYFTPPQQCFRFGVGYCSGGDFVPKLIKDCRGTNLIYLFNIVNCGKFAAKDVRVCVVNEEDAKNVLSIDPGRWSVIKHHSGFPAESLSGDLLPLCLRKGDLILRADDKRIFILLEYRSSYTRKRYKRVYECCIVDSLENCHESRDKKTKTKQSLEEMGFGRIVAIHDIRLIDESKKSISNLKSRISAKIRKKLTHIQNLEDWLLDFE